MTEKEKKLLNMVERGLFLVIRGKTLDEQWRRKQGGSGTVLMAQETIYDDALAAWEKDARELVTEMQTIETSLDVPKD